MAGDDTLYGDGGNDTLIGGLGNNTLYGGAGDNIFVGGADIDTVTYSSAVTAIAASLTSGLGTAGDALNDSYSGIENLIGGAGNDHLIGNGSDNILTGGAGNDILEGVSGTNILIGGAGADTFLGGTGSDTASYADASARVYTSLFDPYFRAGDAIGDTYDSIENLTGSNYADRLEGDGQSNTLIGGLGNDILDGREGNDTIYANQGSDQAFGGDGDDTFHVSTLSGNMPGNIDGGAHDHADGNVVVLHDLVDGGTYNISTLATKLNYIDTLDITDTAATKLQVSGYDIQNMVDNGDTSQLYVKADGGDSIELSPAASASGQTVETTTHTGHTDYTIYDASHNQLALIHWQNS